MRLVIQRVAKAKVEVAGDTVGEINEGLLLLVGFGSADREELSDSEIDKIASKILKLRCFSDGEGKMNLSVNEIGGAILAVSQFTLYGNLRKGNRPSFGPALEPEKANILFERFCESLKKEVEVQTGVFGADMKVELTNDGPVTFIMDSLEILGPRQ